MAKNGQKLANLYPKQAIFGVKPDFKNGLKMVQVGPSRTVFQFPMKIHKIIFHLSPITWWKDVGINISQFTENWLFLIGLTPKTKYFLEISILIEMVFTIHQMKVHLMCFQAKKVCLRELNRSVSNLRPNTILQNQLPFSEVLIGNFNNSKNMKEITFSLKLTWFAQYFLIYFKEKQQKIDFERVNF